MWGTKPDCRTGVERPNTSPNSSSISRRIRSKLAKRSFSDGTCDRLDRSRLTPAGPARQTCEQALGARGVLSEEVRVDLLHCGDGQRRELCARRRHAHELRARIGRVWLASDECLALEAAQNLRGHLDVRSRL